MDLYSIAMYGKEFETVLMIDPDHSIDKRNYRSFRSEQELLIAFFRLVRRYDPDAFVGWNLIGFDLQWLWRKCSALGIKFDIGTDGPVFNDLVQKNNGGIYILDPEAGLLKMDEVNNIFGDLEKQAM